MIATTDWTEERIEKLKTMFADKFSATDIARRLGGFAHCADLGRSAVCGKLHRLGITRGINVGPSAGRKNRVANHERVGAPVGSVAFKVISGIKRKHKLAANPSIDLQPFVCADVADLVPLNIPFSDLERADCKCRWPYDAPADVEGSFVFCGHPTAPDKPYCAGHSAIARQAPRKTERAPYIETGRATGGIFGRVA